MLRMHRVCDDASEKLFYFMVIFSPWAFGTTQLWSIWVMNGVGYLAGFFLAIKLAIRFLTGYRNPRWGERGIEDQSDSRDEFSAQRVLTQALAILTAIILGYCLASALNARVTYNRETATFEYHDVISWLPHSYAQSSSWSAFYNYLAMALSFWALRDWLLGKTSAEELAERSQPFNSKGRRASLLPDRLRRLLWVLSVNGGLLGVESILQRLNGTPYLLFVMPTHTNQDAFDQFGPYAYRSNAAQYFNLLWPVSLGLWWSLERAARRGLRDSKAFGLRARHMILVCAMLMAACPIISASRLGAVVAVMNLAVAAVVLWSVQHKGDRQTKVGIVVAVAVVLGLSACIEWNKLAPRFEEHQFEMNLEGRNNFYDIARPMADDCPLFGTGPGTFGVLFQLYRSNMEDYWPEQLHNDWLETLITFGVLGSVLIALALFIALSHWFVARGIHGSWYLMLLFWAALAGCLFYARYDFPFQIYSVVFLFLVLCAALFTLSHNS
ncbi:MAG: O-antigen ligase family protein [Verrucomicrobiota bacterium]|jgi:O-antigen ligase